MTVWWESHKGMLVAGAVALTVTAGAAGLGCYCCQRTVAAQHASQGSDGTWYVSYRGTDDSSTANADGSISEWKDGYYIAHSWSSGGQMIASKPNTVVVYGKTYEYVSSITVPQNTKWSEVSGFVYANGGIGFQTCVGGGNVIITHYEPV